MDYSFGSESPDGDDWALAIYRSSSSLSSHQLSAIKNTRNMSSKPKS